MIPNLIISVSALAKVGKNHFSYTAPDPTRVYCFNGGAEFVAKKFPNKVIDVVNFRLPIIESDDMRWALPLWDEFRDTYKKDLEDGTYVTYVFDTGTEVENICQQAVLEEQQNIAAEKGKDKQRLATNEFLARNLRMKALFDMAKNAGVNLITLQYLKEEWVREKGRDRAEPTGNLIFDGWRRTESQVDVNLELRAIIKSNRQIAVANVVSNRFDREMNGQTLDDPTFADVVALLLGE